VLEQVASNLLSNAINFTRKDGRIEVRLRGGADEVTLTVSDDGRGIAASDLAHIFENFKQVDDSSTRTTGGLGLGLAIARHLVEAHGGTIVAQSDGVGRGAIFTVRLPRAAPAASEGNGES
jgi:signal transduction histidine kinase